MKLTILLQEISTPGNLGAIARVMANFEVNNLTLVNPQTDKNDLEEIKRAKHSQIILKNAKIVPEVNTDDFDYLIGTTSKLGRDYNLKRSPITIKQLASKLGLLAKKINTSKNTLKNNIRIGLWIGREGDGLTNEEIKKCDILVSIPASKKYPALNISHAVGIMLYELFQANILDQDSKSTVKTTDNFISATRTDLNVAYTIITNVLKNIKFATPEKRETQQILWKKLLGKSMLTKRESMALIGFFKKLLK